MSEVTINVLPDNVMRTVFLSLAAAIVVFVGMLLLTTLHPWKTYHDEFQLEHDFKRRNCDRNTTVRPNIR